MSSLAYFEAIASEWNQMRTGYFEDALKEITIAKDLKNKIVGDFGAGTGFLTLELATRAGHVYALDQSREMLSVLRASSTMRKLNNIQPLIGSFESVPLFDESLDTIFSNMAIHHVDDPKQAFSEMYRVLKPGGTIRVSDVERHDGYWAHEEMHDVWLGFDHYQIREWLVEVGFEMVQIESTGLFCQGHSSKGEFTKVGIFLAQATKPIQLKENDNEQST